MLCFSYFTEPAKPFEDQPSSYILLIISQSRETRKQTNITFVPLLACMVHWHNYWIMVVLLLSAQKPAFLKFSHNYLVVTLNLIFSWIIKTFDDKTNIYKLFFRLLHMLHLCNITQIQYRLWVWIYSF